MLGELQLGSVISKFRRMSIFGDLVSQTEDFSTTSPTLEVEGLPCFHFADFINKDEIAQGGFSTIFTAEIPSCHQKVVVKKLFGAGDEEETRRKMLKEAKLLNNLVHRNIVEFKGVCDDEYALLLEYVYFDFKPFGLRAKVNCLADLLLHLDKNSCANIDKQVFYQAASDVVSGLQYLHESGITHRDLKPANILVSNQHYCQLTNPAKIEEISRKMPLICKLTDFGESRSQDIRTNTILHSKTNQVNRGTPVFMAPELLVNDFQLPAASVEDLKKADIWAYGMVLFNLINPGLKHPFQINIKMKQAGTSLEEFLKAKQKPIAQKKYVLKQSNEWKRLAEIYEVCTEFEPSLRPSAKDVFDSLQVNSGNLINQFQSVEKTTEQISRYVAIVLVHSRSSYIV